MCVLVRLTRRAREHLAATATVQDGPVRRALGEIDSALSDVDDAHVQAHLLEARDWLRAALRPASSEGKGEAR